VKPSYTADGMHYVLKRGKGDIMGGSIVIRLIRWGGGRKERKGNLLRRAKAGKKEGTGQFQT